LTCNDSNHVIKLLATVGEVESFYQTIDEYSGVRGLKWNLGIGTVFSIQGQKYPSLCVGQRFSELDIFKLFFYLRVRCRASVWWCTMKGSDFDASKERSLCLKGSEEKDDKRQSNHGINSVFNAIDKGNGQANGKYNNVYGTDFPKLI
jgi:hypothetical protein